MGLTSIKKTINVHHLRLRMNEGIFSVVRVLMDANADTPKRYEHDNDFRKFVEESIEKRPNLKTNNTYQ